MQVYISLKERLSRSSKRKYVLTMTGVTITVQYSLLICIVWGAWFHWMLMADQGGCRRLKFVPPVDGKRLKSHILLNLSIGIYTSCEHRCVMESRCVSVNIGPSMENDQVTCELNDADNLQFPDDLKGHPGWTYRGTENPCSGRNPCFHNGTCVSGYSDKRFICLCPAGYTGEQCERDIDECATGNHNCNFNAFCNNTKGSYNCTCKRDEGYYGDGKNCNRVSTCKEIYDKMIFSESMAYPLMMDNKVISVYCHMTMNSMGNGACGDGGWTLVMKIDGEKLTFHYDSNLWGNKEAYNITGGETAFDTQETKLPTYWNTSFSKICLGMKVNENLNFVVMEKEASSLYSLIADGTERNTSLGRDTWKKLIGSQASLHQKWEKEGFNVKSGDVTYAKARIGILGNNFLRGVYSKSRIGFGTGGKFDDTNTCGNEATHEADKGYKRIKAMGFIFVQ